MCTRFASLAANATKKRRGGVSPGLNLTLEQFAAWFHTQQRTCRYCRIPEELLHHLDLLTQTGNLLQRLGVDRNDNALPYQLGNLALCCFSCNKVKSNTFTCEEMSNLSPALSSLWVARLAAKGVEWSPAA